MRHCRGIGFLGASVAIARLAGSAELKPGTLAAWEQYRELTEARIASELSSDRGFLAEDFLPPAGASRARQTLAAGEVFVSRLETHNQGKPIGVPEGMIHHWVGSILLPGADLARVLAWVQDYDEHEKYFDEVERSRLLSREGDVFWIFLRLRRKKIVTVYYNTEHLVKYTRHGGNRVSSRSTATRIAELDEPGTPGEREKPLGRDNGFLWRLNSYWRFQQKEGGIIVECESISLSRSIPILLSWLIRGYVESVPRESLERTLISIRDGLLLKPGQRTRGTGSSSAGDR